jgi:hypothetical protein
MAYDAPKDIIYRQLGVRSGLREARVLLLGCNSRNQSKVISLVPRLDKLSRQSICGEIPDLFVAYITDIKVN